MKKHIILTLIVSFIGMFGLTCIVEAGFGVSPPWVKNNYLTPGSHFEQTVYLSRGNPDQELMAEVTIDAPEIASWLTIEKGLRFPLPEGIKQFPMKVLVDVPADAAYGSYHGYIRVRAISQGQPGQVSTILGARIDVDLVVTEKGYADFKIKGAPFIPDVELGTPMVVLVNIENIGNVRIRPSKVHVDIYDISHKILLRSGDITEMEWVEPFETRQVGGELLMDLGLGEYWADVTVYKDGESLGVYKIHFEVVPYVEKTELSEGEGGEFLSKFFPFIGAGIILLAVSFILVWLEKKKGIFKKKVVRKRRKKKEEIQ